MQFRPCLRALVSIVAGLALASGHMMPLVGAEAGKRQQFDVPAGSAERSLKAFSSQAGIEVLFPSDAAAGVRTNAIKGEFTPIEAARQVLAGTVLYVRDQTNGVIRIARGVDPNAPRPAQTTASDRPNQSRAGERTPVADRKPDNDDALVLSPFEVTTTKDYGYQAASSLSGGRLATDLDKTPVAISVMTREFLDDIGALTIQEALQWTTNAVAANETDVGVTGTVQTGVPTLATDNGNIVRTRGFRDSSLARNYFVWLVDSHAYNTERVDISRGPNALVFGDASTGGIINVTTKRAGARPITAFSLNAISTGGGLVTADINRSLTNTLSVRANAVLQRSKGFKDFERDNREGLSLATTWAPTKNTQVRVEGEWGHRYRRMPLAYVLEQTSAWDRLTTVSARLTGAAPAGTGTVRLDTGNIANRPYMVLDIANPSAGFIDWQGFARTDGGAELILPAEHSVIGSGAIPVPVDQTATIGGPNSYPILPSLAWNANLGARRLDVGYYAATAIIEQQFGSNFFVELAANFQSTDNVLHQVQDVNRVFYDINRMLPSGAPNPNFLKPYVEAPGFRIMRTKQDVLESRLSAIYLLDTRLTRQRIGLSASNRQHYYFRNFARLAQINGPSPDTSRPENLVRTRSYLDQRGASLDSMDIEGTYTFGSAETRFVNYQSLGAPGAAGSGGYSGSDSRLWSAQLFAVGDWLDSRRLNTIVGLRRDNLGRDDLGASGRDPVTAEILGKMKTRTTDSYFTSSNVGAVFRIFPSLSVFGNYSESFVANTPGIDVNHNVVDPQRGKGKDFGLKLNLFGGKVTGSVGYYDTIEENNRIGLTVIGTPINQIWSALGSGNSVITGSPDTQLAKATGYELDITANFMRNWSFLFNVGIPTSELERAAPAYRQYIAANRREWEAAIANPATPATTASLVSARLATIDAQLDTLSDGRPVAGVAEWTANFFTRYRFLTGPLKNLTIGGGVNLIGRRFVGSRPQPGTANTIFDYSDGYEKVSALLGYDAKLWGAAWRLQLNVDNLLDDDAFRYTSYNAAGRALQFRTNAPRSFRFSTRVTF